MKREMQAPFSSFWKSTNLQMINVLILLVMGPLIMATNTANASETMLEIKSFPLKGETQKDRKSTRLNSSHIPLSRMPSSA